MLSIFHWPFCLMLQEEWIETGEGWQEVRRSVASSWRRAVEWDGLPCATGCFPGWDLPALWCDGSSQLYRDQIKPFQVDGVYVGVRALLPLSLWILWQGEGEPHWPSAQILYCLAIPQVLPNKYKHSLCSPWWSQGCRESKSSSSSWRLGSPNSAGRHELAHPSDPFSSSLPLVLCRPPAWPASAPVRYLQGPAFCGNWTLRFTVDSLSLSFHSLQRHFYLENT